MEKEDFLGKEGSKYRVKLKDNEEAVFELQTIEDIPFHDPGKIQLPKNIKIRKKPFALTFLHDPETDPDDFPDTQELDVHVSPFQQDKKGIYYEAIFN